MTVWIVKLTNGKPCKCINIYRMSSRRKYLYLWYNFPFHFGENTVDLIRKNKVKCFFVKWLFAQAFPSEVSFGVKGLKWESQLPLIHNKKACVQNLFFMFVNETTYEIVCLDHYFRRHSLFQEENRKLASDYF